MKEKPLREKFRNLDTLKITNQMGNLTYRWTQLGHFFAQLGYFFQFYKIGSGDLLPAGCTPALRNNATEERNSTTKRGMGNKALRFFCQKFCKGNTFSNKYSNKVVKRKFLEYSGSLVLGFLNVVSHKMK